MKLIDKLFAFFGYVDADSYFSLRQRVEVLEKQEAENRMLRREIDEKTGKLEQIEAGLAQRMESMTMIKPGEYVGNSIFMVQVAIHYELFEQFMDILSPYRGRYEYEMIFDSLFRSIRLKFDALLSLGPKAWMTKPPRRYAPRTGAWG